VVEVKVGGEGDGYVVERRLAGFETFLSIGRMARVIVKAVSEEGVDQDAFVGLVRDFQLRGNGGREGESNQGGSNYCMWNVRHASCRA